MCPFPGKRNVVLLDAGLEEVGPVGPVYRANGPVDQWHWHGYLGQNDADSVNHPGPRGGLVQNNVLEPDP